MIDPYLQHLLPHLKSDTRNPPDGYVEWVRSWPRFADGFLGRLPEKAVIVYDTRIEEHLAGLGIRSQRFRRFETGTSTPNRLYALFDDDGKPSLLVNRGLPGGGGITTQAAELYALGVQEIVHVGTCALMGEDVPPQQIVVATSSYKDGASVLISGAEADGSVAPLVHASVDLSERLDDALDEVGAPHLRSCGYTIASFYFQPTSLVTDLVLNRNLPGPVSVGYVEMEQAGLFAVARKMGRAAASLVVGSDRYTVRNGALHHAFEEDFDADEAEMLMLRAAMKALDVG